MTEIKKITDSARFLLDTGLLFELNRRILHPFHMALEVYVDDDGKAHLGAIWDGRKDNDGGIWFDEEAYKVGYDKLNAFMKEEGNALLKSRQDKLGYIYQEFETPPEIIEPTDE